MTQQLNLNTSYYLNGYTKVRVVCNLTELMVECVVVKPAPYSTHTKGDLIWVKRQVLKPHRTRRVRG